MARLTRRSKQVVRKYKKKIYKKKFTKKTYKSSSKGYKSKSLRGTPKKVGSSHWLSIGSAGYFKGNNANGLKNSLKGLGFSTYLVNTTGNVTATPGTQWYDTIASIYNSADISVAGSASLTKRFHKSCVVKITMTNQTNAGIFVDLYDVQARNDTSVVPTSLFDSTQMIYYGASLFSQQSFCETFKINRVTSLNLSSGETAEHRIVTSPNHLFKDDDLTSSTSFRGLTRYVIAVVRGGAYDTTADETVVGSARAKMDFICTKEYKSQTVINSSASYIRGALMSTAADRIMELDGDETTAITA